MGTKIHPGGVLAARLCAVALVSTPGTAAAFDTFGHGGQAFLSLRGDFEASQQTSSYNGSQNTVRQFDLRPSFHYFVHELVFFTVDTVAHYTTGAALAWLFGVGPGFGINIALADTVSFLPRLSFPYEYETGSTNGVSLTAKQWLGILYLPFLFHVTPHFSVGIGPSLTQSLWVRVNGQPGNSLNSIALTGSVYVWL